MFWRRNRHEHRWDMVGWEKMLERTSIPNQPEYVKVEYVWEVAEICMDCGAERVDRRRDGFPRVMLTHDAARLVVTSDIPSPGKAVPVDRG
jgi:hypothetical protein